MKQTNAERFEKLAEAAPHLRRSTVHPPGAGLSSFFHPQPKLDQSADGLGSVRQVFLLASPTIDAGHLGSRHHDGNTGSEPRGSAAFRPGSDSNHEGNHG
jgi:hypothetical protein